MTSGPVPPQLVANEFGNAAVPAQGRTYGLAWLVRSIASLQLEKSVGEKVGDAVGLAVGLPVVGVTVGLPVVGVAVGAMVGPVVGLAVVGVAVGGEVGDAVGTALGTSVGSHPERCVLAY